MDLTEAEKYLNKETMMITINETKCPCKPAIRGAMGSDNSKILLIFTLVTGNCFLQHIVFYEIRSLNMQSNITGFKSKY